ncbi:GAP family protein [Streptomyces sp. NPDC101160]|uniref:GAP family protein n=1 Tax=Streptomyces sp. NPDC101160 TaxID=3366118 RepID=UPI0037F7E1A8
MLPDLILIGLGIAVFPLSVTAFVLVLSADRGTWKGLAFILSWVACFVAVLVAVLVTTGGKPPAPKSPPSTATSAVKLAIGLGLVGYGWYRHKARKRAGARTHPRTDPPGPQTGPGPEPRTGPGTEPRTDPQTDPRTDPSRKSSGRMSARLDRISGWTAAGLGPLLQPWGLVAAGAATVVSADLSRPSSYAALVAYCVLATSSLLAMELYAVFAPDSARLRLGQLRTWFQTHQNQALVGVSLVVGLLLVARSIYQLTS